MYGWRRELLRRAWTLAAWLSARRRVQADTVVPPDTHRRQTRGMGVRMNEQLRDRMRPRWLRLRVPDEEEPEDRTQAD